MYRYKVGSVWTKWEQQSKVVPFPVQESGFRSLKEAVSQSCEGWSGISDDALSLLGELVLAELLFICTLCADESLRCSRHRAFLSVTVQLAWGCCLWRRDGNWPEAVEVVGPFSIFCEKRRLVYFFANWEVLGNQVRLSTLWTSRNLKLHTFSASSPCM